MYPSFDVDESVPTGDEAVVDDATVSELEASLSHEMTDEEDDEDEEGDDGNLDEDNDEEEEVGNWCSEFLFSLFPSPARMIHHFCNNLAFFPEKEGSGVQH